MPNLAFFAPLLGAAGLAVTFFVYLHVKRLPEGGERMREIAALIHRGAMVYLKRQYVILLAFLAAVALALAVFIGVPTAAAYLCGGLFSMLAGVFGMKGATKGNVQRGGGAGGGKPGCSQ